MNHTATPDAVGNQHVQMSLEVSRPGDRWEREADAVATGIMRMPGVDLTTTRGWEGIQRCPGGCPGEEEKDMAMRSADTATAMPPLQAQPASVLRGLSGGHLLTGDQRSFFEPRFGHDFSRVRVHDSLEAGRAASSINARAFTLGKDVVFASGAYRPHSEAGRRLLAHELTHVVQQGEARDPEGRA